MDFLALLTRCKDEPFVEEFVRYYLYEGIDHIYIIDDNSTLIYSDWLLSHPNITIYFEKNIISCNVASRVYDEIREKSEWLIYVDVDEYIATKREVGKNISDVIKSSFNDVDCIKIPWIMMSSNGRDKNPKSLLRETVYRWNHDLKHINKVSKEHKFRCRYDAIETKSIFRPDKFNKIWDHHPLEPIEEVVCVDGVYKKEVPLDPFYRNLREKDIADAYYVCHHYRIISLENSLNKIKSNIWYEKYTVDDLMSSDYAEVLDESLKKRVKDRYED